MEITESQLQLAANGRIDLIGEIDSDVCETFLHLLSVAVELNGVDSLSVVLNSPGGDAFHALAIYDALVKADVNNVTVNVIGLAASAAVIVLQAADTRLATPNSHIMLHEVRRFSMFSERTSSEMQDDADQIANLNTQIMELIAASTGGKLTLEALKENCKKRDWWVSPKDALSLGLIDRIDAE